MTIPFSILISLLLHFFIFYLFVNSPLPDKRLIPNKFNIVFIDNKRDSKQNQVKPFKKVLLSKKNKSLNKISFKRLRNSIHLLARENESIADKVGQFGDKTELKNLSRDSSGSIYNFIYNYISSNFKYPKILRENDIEGFVQVRLVFDKTGKFRDDLIHIKSSSSYLKVLTMRTLHQLFTSNLPFNLNSFPQRYLIIDASFRFLANANNDKSFIRENAYINGNHLSFLVQNQGAKIIQLASNTNKKMNGVLGIRISPEAVLNYFKDNFTDAGKSRALFHQKQLELYKKDPFWRR